MKYYKKLNSCGTNYYNRRIDFSKGNYADFSCGGGSLELNLTEKTKVYCKLNGGGFNP